MLSCAFFAYPEYNRKFKKIAEKQKECYRYHTSFKALRYWSPRNKSACPGLPCLPSCCNCKAPRYCSSGKMCMVISADMSNNFEKWFMYFCCLSLLSRDPKGVNCLVTDPLKQDIGSWFWLVAHDYCYIISGDCQYIFCFISRNCQDYFCFVPSSRNFHNYFGFTLRDCPDFFYVIYEKFQDFFCFRSGIVRSVSVLFRRCQEYFCFLSVDRKDYFCFIRGSCQDYLFVIFGILFRLFMFYFSGFSEFLRFYFWGLSCLLFFFISGDCQDLSGPVFIQEPPNNVDFSNSTGNNTAEIFYNKNVCRLI